MPAAALALVAAAAHLPLVEDHLDEAPYLGLAFLALVVAAITLAAGLVRRDTLTVWRAAAVVPAGAVVAYVYSRAVGLPQASDDVGRWAEPLGVVAVASESLLVVLAVVVLARPTVRPGWGRPWPGIVAALALLVGLAGTVGAASAEAAGTRHEPGAAADMTAMAADAAAGPGTGGTGGYWAAVDGSVVPAGGVTRSYFISSDEVAWNYAPTGLNQITGAPFDTVAKTYLERGPRRVGPVYLKCLYRAYTDATFTTVAPRPAQDAYLGLLGPVIRAEVGDTIQVSFRNTCRIPTSMHPHGVFYTKTSEGAPYADGTAGTAKADDAVAQGERHTYTWKVPYRAGPGPHDGSSVMWMYHSHTDEVGDTYAGLMGPMVVTAKGMARPDGTPKDVDREAFELFAVLNEGASPYLAANVAEYTRMKAPPADDGPDAEDFAESNLKHSVNGYLFGNQPMLTLTKGEHVRWYVMDMGTEVDLHTPHWHGNDVVVAGMRMDVVSLLPAGMVVADMVPDDVGVWLFHCHVNDHLTAGMVSRYAVVG